MVKKYFSLALAILLLIQIFPIYAFASEMSQEIYYMTEFDDIYVDQNGNYVVDLRTTAVSAEVAPQANEDTQVSLSSHERLAVERIIIDFSKPQDITSVLSDQTIPIEIRNSLFSHYKTALENDYIEELVANVFVPSASTPTNGQISPQTITDPEYYTYNGYQMKRYYIHYDGLNTGPQYVYEGIDAMEAADDITTIALMLLSAPGVITSSYGSILLFAISSGKTLFDLFLENASSVRVTGSTQDFIWMQMIYRKAERYTYVYSNALSTWQMGCMTTSAGIKNVHIEQYYYDASTQTGHTVVTEENDIFKVCSSQHYKTSDAFAVQSMHFGIYEYLYGHFGNKTIMY